MRRYTVFFLYVPFEDEHLIISLFQSNVCCFDTVASSISLGTIRLLELVILELSSCFYCLRFLHPNFNLLVFFYRAINLLQCLIFQIQLPHFLIVLNLTFTFYFFIVLLHYYLLFSFLHFPQTNVVFSFNEL